MSASASDARRIGYAAIGFLLAASAQAADAERFVSTLTLPTGQTVVVAEGDLEARSVGSFSVRLYEADTPQNATTFFAAGTIRPRDGVVESVVLADVDGDRRPELVVIVRSVGTGGYLSAHAFAVTANELAFLAAVDDLAADADPVEALTRAPERPQ